MSAIGWDGLTAAQRRTAAKHWVENASSVSIVTAPPDGRWAAPVHVTVIVSPQPDNYERSPEPLVEKPGQSILNTARRLLLAADDAERNAVLGDLYNLLSQWKTEDDPA